MIFEYIGDGAKIFSQTIEVLDLEMELIVVGLQQSAIEDEVNDELMREVRASVRPAAACQKELKTDC